MCFMRIYLILVIIAIWSQGVNGDISIDQMLANNNDNKEYVDDREFTLMELDMIVDKSDKTPSRPERYRAIIYKDETKRWQRHIPFEIGDGIDDHQELAIRRAIPIWEKYSCLHFYNDKQVYNRLVFKRGYDNYCASEVGMKQGPQIVYLGKNCFKQEIVVHEIGHALGFYHEHNRWDRDNYIKIHYENIEPGQNKSFVQEKPENSDFDHDYDYLSIMHYGQYFFSKNETGKLITIETTDPKFQSRIGIVKHPSFQDYKTLNAMYKCEDICAKVECPKDGFLGKHCQCYCKGIPDDTPVRPCFEKKECPKPLINKYLFDVLNKDNTSTINMTRTSFPDKTVLNLLSTNWNCTLASQLRCEGNIWITTMSECPTVLDIEMISEEGVVEVILNDVYRGYICDDDWDDNDATVACKMLGYTKGLAYFSKPKEVNESLPILLDNVRCRGEELSLADCKHNGWGNHNCLYSEVVSVKCFDDSFTNHMNSTTNITCGKIKLHNSKRKKRQVRVTGGLETVKGMLPWQVNIQRRKKRRWIHWCGGTIINNEWILSAAHCFDDFVRSYDGLSAKLNIKDIRVIVGDHDLTKHDEYEKKLDVEYIVKHWNYIDFKRIYNNNDIALLKVKSTGGITFNDYIQPACLPEDLTLLLSETKCEVSGWGKTNFLSEISDKLKAAEVPIIPDHVCQSNYQQYSIDFEKVICAGDTTADTCQGDSGGPLICEINGLSTVIGITSWGKGCGQEESPGVYTKVSEYIRWINDQITNHQLEGCILSDDQRFMYMDMNGVEIKPGERIAIGTTLKAHCRFIDEYSYLTYDYDYYNNDTYTAMDDKTLTCEGDRKMSQIQKQCPEAGKNNECMSIDNGLVAKTKDYYIISCHKGFLSILNEIEDERYNCINGTLRSYITRQEPLCLPDPCTVPYDMDKFLTISDKYRIYLSGGAVVEVGDIVYFNCSMAGNDIHEPVNRRFKCINGMWIEDERDKTWKFGNNGNFPICRKAICEPVCQNEGVCSRDDYCKCKHFTTGKRCENVVCDDECYVNNGECVGPRKCKCPEWKFGTNCELSSCRLPENKNMAKVTTQRLYFANGETVRTFTCGSGHFPSSDQGMTCRSDGSWSDIITCEKGNYYMISTKTGIRRFTGTDANVYITLFGSRGSTRRINFMGKFESGDVDEIRIFSRDVGPIQSVQIGHDGGEWLFLSNWYLEYVSIYVEDMEEFYVFRNIKQQWVREGSDLTVEREGNQSCINTFDEKYLWYPRWMLVRGFLLGRGMSSRVCKQACINWSKNVCNGFYRDTMHTTCYGFTETRDEYFTVKKEPWSGELFFRTCKKFN